MRTSAHIMANQGTHLRELGNAADVRDKQHTWESMLEHLQHLKIVMMGRLATERQP